MMRACNRSEMRAVELKQASNKQFFIICISLFDDIMWVSYELVMIKLSKYTVNISKYKNSISHSCLVGSSSIQGY